MTTFDEIRAICARLPGSIEGEGRFGFGVMVKGKHKGYCWTWMERVHPKKPKEENLRVIAVRVPSVSLKEILIADGPDALFDEPHYAGYPDVLVRLDVISPARLEDLLIEAHRTLAPSR